MNVSLTSEMSILKNLNFRKKKIKNSDTKKLKKKNSESLFVYHHQINNLQLNFNLELTHVFRNFKLPNSNLSENRFSNNLNAILIYFRIENSEFFRNSTGFSQWYHKKCQTQPYRYIFENSRLSRFL